MKHIIQIVILTISLAASAQENGKIKVKSFSFTHGISESPSSSIYDSGPHLGLDLATVFKDNILSMNIGLGSEFSIFGSGNMYHELNLTYGREVHLKRWFVLEGHFGLGYINQFGDVYENGEFVRRTKRLIGVPLRLKTLFYTGKHFGLGINANMSLNSYATMFSGGILFQYAIIR